IKRYDGTEYELFNLAQDIGEADELSKQIPAKVKELDAKILKWLQTTGAKVPKLNPEYVGNK
ncbi:MAG: aryl-sulfate sulfohydrolase, partial [Verrucomicrobiales bacterium]|nr:aryl-sulfate sulfohydrolase [Verrucomicrobiales bacterium]